MCDFRGTGAVTFAFACPARCDFWRGAMCDKSRATWAVIVAVGLLLPTASGAENAPASAPAAAAANTDGRAPPLSVTILGAKQALGVLGKEVLGAAGQNMGRIVDIIVDRHGLVRAAIIDFGGFLRVGSRKIAVDWAALRFPPADSNEPIILELTKDQVRGGPEYEDQRAVVVMGTEGGPGLSVQPTPARLSAH
jgi:hypothetical protein